MRPWVRDLWTNIADGTALSSFTSEASLIAFSPADLPAFPALFFNGKDRTGLWFELEASGVLSCTGTPTYTFGVHLGSAGTVAGDTAIGVSAAITCASGITNKWWRLWLRATLRTPGQGAGACTFSVDSYVVSPGGFASPFMYAIEPTTPDTATWTVAPISSLVQNYLQLGVACSASSGSNAITCKNARVITNG